jgi:SNF2 family DNA or RNA helicase
MVEYRDYQLDIIERGANIINEHGFLYLAMEVRTGKTLTSFGICERIGAQNVLFLTKKKAISSITGDLDKLCPSYVTFVINYESIHKLPSVNWDVIVCDEAHSMGAFPKPSKRAKDVASLIYKNKSRVILLSGTPTPESYSQMYHQVYGIPTNPFSKYKNFYGFARDYVNISTKRINGYEIKDYGGGVQHILDLMAPYTISYTQREAGFVVETTENVLEVELKTETYDIIKRLRKTAVVEGKTETILGDTAVKMMTKIHQLCSGTVKFESGNSMVIDTSKAEFIKQHFGGRKIGIFYKFKEELAALRMVFSSNEITESLDEFNAGKQVIALQIVSGREGISLRNAEALVYYNIDFSATSYWQSKDRMTTMDRLKNDVYWVFAKGGIEREIYKAVTKKKDYTLSHFKRDLVTLLSDD